MMWPDARARRARTTTAAVGSRRGRRTLALTLAGVLLLGCHRHAPEIAPAPAPEPIDAVGPDSFRVRFVTSRGLFEVMAHREWAPKGVDRFHYLVKHGYYDGVSFYRVIPGFVAQFGISPSPDSNAAWASRPMVDEPVSYTNARGTIAFARDGPNTRTVQLFINLRDNRRLDTLGKIGFPPIAVITSGMGVVDSLYSGYGEGPPRGKGPSQDSIAIQGNTYLQQHFPRLDYIVRAEIEQEW